MGLRLLAHFYDQNEAVIVASVLDAAGIPVFTENYLQNVAQPFSQIGLGGYRLMVCEEDLDAALAVLGEARRKRSFEGERLTQIASLWPTLLLLFTLGVPLVFQSTQWRCVDDE